MSLAEAIDALVEYVERFQLHHPAPGERLRVVRHDELMQFGPEYDEFLRLDSQVYIEARKAELLGALPRDDNTADGTCGRTHLPVIKMLDGVIPRAIRWKVDMATLRALAGAGSEQPKKRRRRRQSETKPLTAKQREAVEIVAECKGDIAEAARRLGKDRKTVEQHYKAGLEKLGEATGRRPETRQLQTGLRGQYEVTADEDRRARIRPTDRRRSG